MHSVERQKQPLRMSRQVQCRHKRPQIRNIGIDNLLANRVIYVINVTCTHLSEIAGWWVAKTRGEWAPYTVASRPTRARLLSERSHMWVDRVTPSCHMDMRVSNQQAQLVGLLTTIASAIAIAPRARVHPASGVMFVCHTRRVGRSN